jgi:two-component system sensor histidine kinase UhpB
MSQLHAAIYRLLQIPLFYKILLVNSAIVGLGAFAGTLITVWHVTRFPNNVHYELIFVFATVGIIISFVVNRWVLAQTLKPLSQLQNAVDQVRQGETQVRVPHSRLSDEQFERLIDTFNHMLSEQERHALEMQNLPRRMLRVQEEERQRLSRELHDEAAQALTSLLVHLRLLERAHTPEQAQERVQELRQLTAQALEEVRRVALDLRPTILDDLGLAAALEWRAEEFTKTSQIEANIHISGLSQRLPRDIELVFYRVGQEAFSNIARHAHAQNVRLVLTRQNNTLHLEIQDDGQGFNPQHIQPHNTPRGLGLLGMRERMAMINGHCHINSTPGNGTRIIASAPLTPIGDDNGYH